MTLSSLCLMLINAANDLPDRRAECAIAAILIGPAALIPPISVWFGARQFQRKYVLRQFPASKKKGTGTRFREFLENFGEREVDAPMYYNVIAELLLPFAADKWPFAVAQLVEVKSLGKRVIFLSSTFNDFF